MALGDMDAPVRFDTAPGPLGAKISKDGDLVVACRSGDSLVLSGEAKRPDVVKVDVEGAGRSVLLGARALLESRSVVWLMDTHGPEQHLGCLQLFESTGYTVGLLDRRRRHNSREIFAYP